MIAELYVALLLGVLVCLIEKELHVVRRKGRVLVFDGINHLKLPEFLDVGDS